MRLATRKKRSRGHQRQSWADIVSHFEWHLAALSGGGGLRTQMYVSASKAQNNVPLVLAHIPLSYRTPALWFENTKTLQRVHIGRGFSVMAFPLRHMFCFYLNKICDRRLKARTIVCKTVKINNKSMFQLMASIFAGKTPHNYPSQIPRRALSASCAPLAKPIQALALRARTAQLFPPVTIGFHSTLPPRQALGCSSCGDKKQL